MTKKLISTCLAIQIGIVPTFSFGGSSVRLLRYTQSNNIDPSLVLQMNTYDVDWVELKTESQKDQDSMSDSEKAEKSLKDATVQYKSVKLSEALKLIQSAKVNANYTTLRESYFTEALIGFAQRNLNLTRTALDSYISLQGSAPQAGYYSSSFLKLYKEEKQKILGREAGFLHIEQNFPADVYLDGNFMGKGSLMVRDLSAGVHHLEVRAVGFESYSHIFTLDSSEKNIQPEMKMLSTQALFTKARNANSLEDHLYYLALIQKKENCSGAVEISDLKIQVSRNGRQLYSSPLTSSGGMSVSSLESFKMTMATFMPHKTTVAETQLAQASSTSHSSSSHWYSSVWFWSIVGGAAAAGGGAMFMKGSGGSGSMSLSAGSK